MLKIYKNVFSDSVTGTFAANLLLYITENFMQPSVVFSDNANKSEKTENKGEM